jgi:diacylglycerol kinase (ATP)
MSGMERDKRILFIVNPISGGNNRLDVANLIKSHPFPLQPELQILATEYAGHATSLARQAAREGFGAVVAVGGDGTVNEVARGLIGTDTALAIVPRGSGNGLARHLGIPLRINQALQVIGRFQTAKIDSATINSHPFFCTAGLGFDGHISSVFATSKTRGFRSYAQLILREFKQYEPKNLQISFDDNSLEKVCFLLAFGNASQYGNNAFIAPDADIQDGLLDLCLIPRLSLAKALQTGFRLLTRQMATSRNAAYFKASSIKVRSERPVKYHADGEYVGEGTDFSVEVFPLSLHVMVPALRPWSSEGRSR